MNDRIPDPMPTGQLVVGGGNDSMPNRGTSTGVTDTYGADLSQGADNRIRGFAAATRSDPAFEDSVGGDTGDTGGTSHDDMPSDPNL